MVGKFNIGKFRISLTFRHKWEKLSLEHKIMLRGYKLGLWFKKSKILGRSKVKSVSEWVKTLYNLYTFGLDLIVINFWIDIDCAGK